MFYKCCDGCRKLLNKLKKSIFTAIRYGTISLEIWIYENMILYLICDGFRHMERAFNMKFIAQDDKDMSNGMRDMSRTPLTDKEIEYVKSEIRRIGADESRFVFNDEVHMQGSTCYNFMDDIVYVTRNVFPDTKYGSIHPRDIMSVGAVLAHEYYGHRAYREEYIDDFAKGNNYHTTPAWQDECRASIVAAKTAPGLTNMDKANLVLDAVYRAHEYNQKIEMDSFMKEAVYGYSDGEKNITYDIGKISYVSEEVQIGNDGKGEFNSDLSDMWSEARDYQYPKR